MQSQTIQGIHSLFKAVTVYWCSHSLLMQSQSTDAVTAYLRQLQSIDAVTVYSRQSQSTDAFTAYLM